MKSGCNAGTTFEGRRGRVWPIWASRIAGIICVRIHAATKVVVALLAAMVGGSACGTTSGERMSDRSVIVRRLAEGDAVLGIFSGEKTAEQGAVMAQNREIDFVFYSLERGPFDLPQMQEYMRGLRDGAGEIVPHPIALRVPPIRDGVDSAGSRVRQAIDAGVAAVVFPHIETADDAVISVSSMGDELWPGNRDGRLVNMLIIEDRVGVGNARAIVGTPGVSVVFAGPGDLRRAYEGDMDAVERAIQTVLAACKEFAVPCGITAGVEDIGDRLEQGFRVIIVTEAEALSVGKRAIEQGAL